MPESTQKRERAGGGGLTLTLLIGISYGVSYGFYLVLSRVLPISMFGIVGSYLAFLGLLTLASTAITFSASRLVAEEGTAARAASVRSGYLSYLLPLALAAIAIGILAALQSLELAILIATAGIVPLRDLHCGLLSGLKLNFRWGAVVLIESIIRLGGAAATAWFPYAWLALTAWLVSLAVGTLLGMAFLPRKVLERAAAPPRLKRTTVEAALFRAPQVSFLNIDVVIAAAVFGMNDAAGLGLYVGAATLSRIPFYLATSHALGEMATITEEKGKGPATGRAIRYGLLLSALFAIPLVVLPGLALTILLGPAYAPAAALLSLLAMTSFFLVQANTLSTILFASGRGQLSASLMITGASLEIVLGTIGVSTAGATGLAIATVVAAVATTLLLVAPMLASWHTGSKR